MPLRMDAVTVLSTVVTVAGEPLTGVAGRPGP